MINDAEYSKYIRKYWFGVETGEELAPNILLMEQDRLEQYKGAMDSVSYQFQGVFKGVTGKWKERRVSVVYSLGPGHIADCVTFLSIAAPISRIFCCGTIGGIHAETGDIIVTNSCCAQDGFSLVKLHRNIQYDSILGPYVQLQPSETLALDPEIIAPIEKEFACRVSGGSIFTAPAVSIEDRLRMNRIKELEFTGIDLDTGPFLSASKMCGLRAAVLHWVTDLPMERDFYYPYYGNPEIIRRDKNIKHKQWLNMPRIILPLMAMILETDEAPPPEASL